MPNWVECDVKLDDFELAVCKHYGIKCISRDSDLALYNYIQFWSGNPRRVSVGKEGTAYFRGTDSELIMKLYAECFSVRIKPGTCLRVLDDGRCEKYAQESE